MFFRTWRPSQKTLTLDAGGATAAFTLDAKGRAKNANGSLKIKLKLTRDKATKTQFFAGGNVPFKAQLSAGTWSDDWSDEGVANTKTKNAPMTLHITIALNAINYTATLNALYSANGTSGAFKSSR